jgi:hypothetical protein
MERINAIGGRPAICPLQAALVVKGSGDKVAWIEKKTQRLFEVAQPDFAPRAASSRPCISCNKQPAGVLELAKPERRAPQSR